MACLLCPRYRGNNKTIKSSPNFHRVPVVGEVATWAVITLCDNTAVLEGKQRKQWWALPGETKEGFFGRLHYSFTNNICLPSLGENSTFPTHRRHAGPWDLLLSLEYEKLCVSHSCKSFRTVWALLHFLPPSLNIPEGFDQVILVSADHEGLVVWVGFKLCDDKSLRFEDLSSLHTCEGWSMILGWVFQTKKCQAITLLMYEGPRAPKP